MNKYINFNLFLGLFKFTFVYKYHKAYKISKLFWNKIFVFTNENKVRKIIFI